MESHPTHLVHLSGLSGHQAGRLRNGHACRCALGSKGEGISAHLSEDNIKKLLKAGKKGAKATIKMAKHEIEKNKIEGTGVCGGKIHIKKPKHIGKTLKHIVHSKPVQAVKKIALQEGADMAKAAMVEAGVPSPIANMAVSAGQKKLDKATGGKIHVGKTLRKIGKSKPVQSLKKHAIKKGGEKLANLLEEQGVPKPIARGAVRAGSKKLDKATGGSLGGYGMSSAIGGYGMRGGAIGPTSRVTNVGAGGDLLGPANPALRSQAGSSNFFFHTQFPPGMAASIVGSGLYA